VTYFFIAFGGYLIGSIPSAFLLVRRQAGVDIRSVGSGNVGGFNAYTVTNSRWIGIAVGVLDALKGVAAVLLAGWLTEWNFWMQSTGLIAALIGHNYPVWLKFKGGRGLATAAGGSLLLGVPGFLAWGVVWVIVYKVTKDILRGNSVRDSRPLACSRSPRKNRPDGICDNDVLRQHCPFPSSS
jgi:glycerol-3-phosphate acyltransferase PlsY